MASLLESVPLELLARVYARMSPPDRRALLAAMPRSHLRSLFRTAVRDPSVYWLEAPKLLPARFPRLATVTLCVGTRQALSHLRKQGIEPIVYADKLRFTCTAGDYWCNRALVLPGARVTGIRRAYLTQSRAAAGAALALADVTELHVVVEEDGARVPYTTARRLTVTTRSPLRLQAWLPDLPGLEQLSLINVASCFGDATEPLAGLPSLNNLWLDNADLAGWGPLELIGILRQRGITLGLAGRFSAPETEEWLQVLNGAGRSHEGWVDPDEGTLDVDMFFFDNTTDA